MSCAKWGQALRNKGDRLLFRSSAVASASACDRKSSLSPLLRSACPLFCAVAFAACVRPPDSDFERIELTVCDGGDACSLVADGVSQVTVRACVSERVPDPLADVDLKLSWSAPGSDDVTGSVKEQRCLDGVFTAPSTTQHVRVEAALGDFRKSLDLALAPAPLSAVELVPSPSALAPGEDNDLHVKVRSAAGRPTIGTRIAVTVSAQAPATPGVQVWPPATLVDADGEATFSVYVGTGITSVTYQVTATGPGGGSPVTGSAVVPARQ